MRRASGEVTRYAAFTDTPAGGNPAGVILDASALSDERMLAIAVEVGDSESAFLTPRTPSPKPTREYDARYFSVEAEVTFCGHATIASAIALAERDGPGPLIFHTRAGEVPVETRFDGDGRLSATLTSVAPAVLPVDAADLQRALEALRWAAEDLDPSLPPRIGYAGARHLILAARTRERLAELDYDFESLKGLMLENELTTVALVWREDDRTFHARNPFPVGGVVEDPATGAAAAAFGGYLRELGAVTPPITITIYQGQDMGRPSRLRVDIDDQRPGIAVTGRGVALSG